MSALIVAATGSALVEQIGSYAGLACMLGLAVMALLYFSQAREVRRLREWAGREPERAAELAQRVQADPQRRVVAQPIQPTTPAAQQQQATAALYASVGATPPPGTVAPAGSLARPAATPAAGLLPAAGAVANPAVPGAPAAPVAPGAAAAAAGAAAAGAGAVAQAPGAAGTPSAPPVPGAPAAPASTQAPAAPPAPMPAPTPSPGVGGPQTGTASPGQPAPASAAATRAAAAQRSASLSAYANGSTGQETRESAAARPEPLAFADDDEGGLSRGRIALYAGGGLAAAVVAVVLMLVLTGGDDTQPPNDFGNTPAQESEGTSATPNGSGSQGGSGSTSPSGLTAAERRATKVAVLNGTTQSGLARNVGDKIEKARFTIESVGNNADQQIPATIVSFTAGNEPAARAVAKLVGVASTSVQPADANAAAAADADVIVTVGLDQSG